MSGKRLFAVLVAGFLCTFAAPVPAQAQARLRDLVFTLGGSAERYAGNFTAVTVTVVDSTNHASAVVGEMGVRGAATLYAADGRSLDLSFDGGLRQTAAMGFRFRDYAPREWVGNTELTFSQNLGSWGSIEAGGSIRSRSIQDRPPMPMFLQPGYTTTRGTLSLLTRSFDGVGFDLQFNGEAANYKTLALVPQLALLDRSGRGFDLGARWGSSLSHVRFHGGVQWTDYRNQGTFDPRDPFRRDHTVRVGFDWSHAGNVFLQVGADGVLNRSNSNRPEYDAVSARALLSAPLPENILLNIYTVVTAKSYVHDTPFARLVPGEEADNASIAYLQLGRPLASNLDGAIRFAWSRAETNIGRAYYQRFGTSIQFNYRPFGY